MVEALHLLVTQKCKTLIMPQTRCTTTTDRCSRNRWGAGKLSPDDSLVRSVRVSIASQDGYVVDVPTTT